MEFYKQSKRGVAGVRGTCKACDNIKKQAYRVLNRDSLLKTKKADYESNKEHYLANKKEYRQVNKGKINALVAARKLRIKVRTPKWTTDNDRWMIKEAYELAALRTKLFGFSWHVDHVIPLQGKQVSGFHTPYNLKVIPWLENVVKKNKFEVANA